MNDTTNLCNFYQPQEFCRQVTQRLEVIAPHQYAIVVLDIKNFSEINNLFGYKVGNQVLHRLETCFGAALKQDEFFCRLHGDHFAFFVHIEPQVSLRSRFLALTEFTNCLSGILPDLYPCVCKGGIIFIDNPAEDVVALLDKADFARKHAKDNQNRDFLYFDPKLAQELKWRNTITLTMQEALDNHEFEMYLQPKVLIKTGQVVGAEALTRWNSKKYGLIYPDQFIPILEKNGFIVQLDFYILGQACQFIQESLAAGRPPQPISINFSKAHLGRKDFAEIVFEVVRQYGIPTRLIEIEMTESMMSNDMQLLIDIASSLKYLGFKVSLDDFGSAYSSLNYLKDMPFDLIKIDKEFLNTTNNTNKGLVIVAKMVELIKSIQMIPVMEGVETAEQVDFLEKSSCDLGQGYFFSQPLPIGEYKAYLDRSSILADGDSQPCTGEQQPPQQNFYAIPMEF
ncbi:MAG: GGDEF domain-containing phosphodiesterase, partial [Clostridiales bacterium]